MSGEGGPVLVVRDTKNGRVKELELTKRRFSIGRGDQNDLVLPRDTVSREHCLVYQRDDGLFVRDLSSRTGTLVEGEPIAEDTPLADGVRFCVGEFELHVRQGAAPRARSGGSGGAGSGGAGSGERPGERPAREEPARRDDRPRAPQAAGERADPMLEARRACHALLLASRDLKRVDFERMAEDKAREMTEKVLVQIITDLEDAGKIPGVDRRRLLREVLDEALGLGPLESLLADDDISEVMVNAYDRIFVEKRGEGMIRAPVQFTSNEQVMHVIRRILAPIGRRINEQTPLVDGRLLDGSRVNAIIPPLAVSGPSITIRKFPKHRLGVGDLIKFGSLTDAMGRFLEVAVREHMNICISGGTGSGKTTLLNVVSGFIGPKERIVTVEDVSELRLPQEHVVTLESRPANLEGEGAITIRDLVKNCLRMRPDRIVVGECRGGEALDMLQAMNTGHDGSLTTIHSNSPRDCIARLETLVLMAGMDLPSRAIREQVASAIHLIVQQQRLVDGSRKVTAISEVTGLESGVVTLQDIFLFTQTGFDEKKKVVGHHEATGNVPKFIHALRRRGVDIDLSMFARNEPQDDGRRKGAGRR